MLHWKGLQHIMELVQRNKTYYRVLNDTFFECKLVINPFVALSLTLLYFKCTRSFIFLSYLNFR